MAIRHIAEFANFASEIDLVVQTGSDGNPASSVEVVIATLPGTVAITSRRNQITLTEMTVGSKVTMPKDIVAIRTATNVGRVRVTWET